jgi:hypothetical protein
LSGLQGGVACLFDDLDDARSFAGLTLHDEQRCLRQPMGEFGAGSRGKRCSRLATLRN